MRADTLLARRHETEREKPLVQRNLAVLEDRPDRDGKEFGAGVALVNAGARTLALHFCDAVNRTAMRAERPVRPMQRL